MSICTKEKRFADKTVLVVAAGCRHGAAIVQAYADEGARVVAVDVDETRLLPVAESDPRHIDVLKLDVFKPSQCDLFHSIWKSEPIDALVQLQALRHPERLGAAVAGISYLTRLLVPALRVGGGRNLYLFADVEEDGPAEHQAFTFALSRLAQAIMNDQRGRDVFTNALVLPAGLAEGETYRQMTSAVLHLTHRDAGPLAGAVLPLALQAY